MRSGSTSAAADTSPPATFTFFTASSSAFTSASTLGSRSLATQMTRSPSA